MISTLTSNFSIIFIPKVFKSLETDRETYESKQHLRVSNLRKKISTPKRNCLRLESLIESINEYAKHVRKVKELKSYLSKAESIDLKELNINVHEVGSRLSSLRFQQQQCVWYKSKYVHHRDSTRNLLSQNLNTKTSLQWCHDLFFVEMSVREQVVDTEIDIGFLKNWITSALDLTIQQYRQDAISLIFELVTSSLGK